MEGMPEQQTYPLERRRNTPSPPLVSYLSVPPLWRIVPLLATGLPGSSLVYASSGRLFLTQSFPLSPEMALYPRPSTL